MSEPASTSEKPWHHRTSPRAIRPRWYCFCSGVPAAMMAGPIQLTFMYCGPRGSPAPHISSPRMVRSHGDASLPPYSIGQCGVSSPRSASAPQNAMHCALCTSVGRSLSSWLQPAGMWSRITERTSSRNSRSSPLHPNSMASPLRTVHEASPRSADAPASGSRRASGCPVGTSLRSVDRLRLARDGGERNVAVGGELSRHSQDALGDHVHLHLGTSPSEAVCLAHQPVAGVHLGSGVLVGPRQH